MKFKIINFNNNRKQIKVKNIYQNNKIIKLKKNINKKKKN